jgi:tRNA 2-thiocytidine biosynthesis protein TtcA
MSKREIPLKDKLAYYLLKSVNKAIRDYGMVADGDRIAVGVSGGKDSLALTHLLRLRQESTPEGYQIVAVHVDQRKVDGTSCAGPAVGDALRAYFEACGQAFAVESVEMEEASGCFRCSYLRRKALFTAARRLGCNKVALGHHADDAAQTTLLNLAFHGRVETLQPVRSFFDGRLVLIRPMIYVPEKDILRLARAGAFPVVASPCVHGMTSQRVLAKEIIRLLEREYPKVKINLFRAGLATGTMAEPAQDSPHRH